MFFDADNGGKLGPIGYAGFGFGTGFYTDTAGTPVEVPNVGSIVVGRKSKAIVVGSPSRAVVIGKKSKAVIDGRG